MDSELFEGEFEREVIAQSAKDPSFRRRAVRIIGKEHQFTNETYTWLWTVIAGLKGDDKITSRVLQHAANSKFSKEDERDDALLLAVKVMKVKSEAPNETIKMLQDYKDYQRMKDGMLEAAKLMSKGRVQEAKTKLRGISKNTESMVYTYTDWIDDFDARMKERERIKEAILTDPTAGKVALKFSKTIDSILTGGLGPQQVGLVVATTGRGKSFFAANIAFYAALQGFTTLYVSTEMSEELVATRLDSKFLDIPAQIIKNVDFTDEEREAMEIRLKRMSKRLKGKLRVASIPVRRARMAIVEEMMEEMADEGNPVQLLIVDSADHFTPDERTLSRRDKETAAYWELKSIAAEYKIPVWTTTHAPKEVVNKLATSENVGESYDKARIADILITLNQTKAQQEKKEMRALIGKNREGEGNIVVNFVTDFARATYIEVSESTDGEPKKDENE